MKAEVFETAEFQLALIKKLFYKVKEISFEDQKGENFII